MADAGQFLGAGVTRIAAGGVAKLLWQLFDDGGFEMGVGPIHGTIVLTLKRQAPAHGAEHTQSWR